MGVGKGQELARESWLKVKVRGGKMDPRAVSSLQEGGGVSVI